MAKRKKPSTPPPRVQAPQRRSGSARKAAEQGDDVGLRHRAVLYGVAGAGFLGLIGVALVLALGGGKSGDPKRLGAAMAAANCTFKTVTAYVPKGQSTHVPSLTKKLPWNTDPPSNGQHYPEWAVWGFYNQPVNPRMVVHNEEHGGVILWWGSKVPSSTVAKLLAFYTEQPDGSFGTPYPTLGSKIAITAWTGESSHYQQDGYYGQGHIAICPNYTAATKKAFEDFRNLYRGHGPEGIPLSADKPGDGPTTPMSP
jgi:Protein of unknown function (DUF3105)